MTPERRVRIAGGQTWRQEEARRRKRASLFSCLVLRLGRAFRRAKCGSSSADEARAVLVSAAGTVAGREEVQLVDHMVVTTREGLVDPGSLQDRQFERSFHERPAVPIVNEVHVGFAF